MLTTGFLHPGMTLTFQLCEHKQRSGPSSSSQGQMETFRGLLWEMWLLLLSTLAPGTEINGDLQEAAI